jgi:hypothetical protein
MCGSCIKRLNFVHCSKSIYIGHHGWGWIHWSCSYKAMLLQLCLRLHQNYMAPCNSATLCKIDTF